MTDPTAPLASDAAPAPVDEGAIADLRERLSSFRRADIAAASGWSRGVPPELLEDYLASWRTEYDWRRHEARIRGLPWLVAGRQRPIRLIRQPGGPKAPTVVLLHGWPDSVLRFDRLLPRLDDLDVIIPALPGYPFALPDPRGGVSSGEMAAAVADALDDLGIDRYVLSAGDIGCDVAEAVAAAHPERVAALHLTDVSQLHYLVDPPGDLSAAEQRYVARGHRWQAEEGGYMHEQSTKLQTLTVGLGDSPAGLAAWILEKLHGWSDHDGDLESVFPRDDILTWISAYWFAGCIGTSFSPYAEGAEMAWPRIPVPTAFTIFPKDLVNAPREFADRFFDVRWWREFDRGGHFAAFERPGDYETGLRAAVALAEGVSAR